METMKALVPPIKSQGIKTKLVPRINDLIACSGVDLDNGGYFEPFFGTGVVGFNVPGTGSRIVSDINPHIIDFYRSVQDGVVNSGKVREYLETEGENLYGSGNEGVDHYMFIRDRFNMEGNPLDFLFLTRSCFNGIMRFNKSGKFNTPFCKDPERFSRSYITKICDQIENIYEVISRSNWNFSTCDFEETISKAGEGDIIYCDPPYYGRTASYYDNWTLDNELRLADQLKNTSAKFILSTWVCSRTKQNELLFKLWKDFNIITRDHEYFVGGTADRRTTVKEAFVCNFDVPEGQKLKFLIEDSIKQYKL